MLWDRNRRVTKNTVSGATGTVTLRGPARTQGGYRLYEEREIADLEFIQKAQQLGFSLNEIRGLFSIRRRPHEDCEHVRDLSAQRLVV